jgi:hypothetical protein
MSLELCSDLWLPGETVAVVTKLPIVRIFPANDKKWIRTISIHFHDIISGISRLIRGVREFGNLQCYGTVDG